MPNVLMHHKKASKQRDHTAKGAEKHVSTGSNYRMGYTSLRASVTHEGKPSCIPYDTYNAKQ